MNCSVEVPQDIDEGTHTLKITGNSHIGYCEPNEANADVQAEIQVDIPKTGQIQQQNMTPNVYITVYSVTCTV